VIVDGLLSFHTQTLRNFFDVKVFLAPQEDLRRVWKIRRDTTKRGYTRDQVLDSLRKRQPDSEQFIRPQQKYADIVVTFSPPDDVSPEDAGAQLNARLTLRPTIPHPDLSYLLEDDRNARSIRLELGRDFGLPVDFLEIEGAVSGAHAQELEAAIWRHMPDLQEVTDTNFGEYLDGTGVRHSHPLALTQLLITYHLLRKYADISQLPFARPAAALTRMQPAESFMPEPALG
jgi:phosphoribulokinase